MAARGVTRRSRIRDQVSGCDGLTARDDDPGVVAVPGRDAAAVVDLDEVAVSAVVPGQRDLTGRRRVNGSPQVPLL